MTDDPTPPLTDPTVLLDAMLRRTEGTLDGDTSATLQQHLATHPAAARFAQLLETARRDDEAATDAELSARAATLLDTRAAPPTRRIPSRLERWPLQTSFRLGIVTALLAVILGVVAREKLLNVVPQPHTHALRTYATAVGQRASVTLPDGSRILLAPRTTLTLDAAFGHDARTVTLSGEAWFEVTSRHGAPFIVRTGVVRTRVLGTQFDVRHYADDRDVRIAVAQGKVVVSSTSRRHVSATLSAGVAASITDSTALTTSIVDMTEYTGWTHDQLEFANTLLPDVLTTVGRWYGYRFRLADSTLAHERLTATFDYASKPDVIKALEALLSVSATLEPRGADTVVTLRRRGRTTTAPPRRHDTLSTFSTSMEVGR